MLIEEDAYLDVSLADDCVRTVGWMLSRMRMQALQFGCYQAC